MRLIEAFDLSVKYGAMPVLEHVDFHVSEGEILTVVGPNGSGKSTLIRALLGVVPLAGGRVVRREGLRIGYVPQRLKIDETMPLTVARFLALPRRVVPSGPASVSDVIEWVGASGLEDRQMVALSGGQFQRVLLARALLGEPEILILDEPTQGLDQQGVAVFYRLIEEVRRKSGCAVLLVSHDLHVVMSASDRVICLNGHVCCEGTPQVVLEAPEYRALFGVGTGGALALYRHEHDHHHDHDHSHTPEHSETH
ncbi:MAG: metal ABC transporter ATP-binding protein [Paracoccaceae bacterium]